MENHATKGEYKNKRAYDIRHDAPDELERQTAMQTCRGSPSLSTIEDLYERFTTGYAPDQHWFTYNVFAFLDVRDFSLDNFATHRETMLKEGKEVVF